jgi:hypothetical protein
MYVIQSIIITIVVKIVGFICLIKKNLIKGFDQI